MTNWKINVNDAYHIAHIVDWAAGCYMANILSDETEPCETAWKFWKNGIHVVKSVV